MEKRAGRLFFSQKVRFSLHIPASIIEDVAAGAGVRCLVVDAGVRCLAPLRNCYGTDTEM